MKLILKKLGGIFDLMEAMPFISAAPLSHISGGYSLTLGAVGILTTSISGSMPFARPSSAR